MESIESEDSQEKVIFLILRMYMQEETLQGQIT